jgi:hypothetical protein
MGVFVRSSLLRSAAFAALLLLFCAASTSAQGNGKGRGAKAPAAPTPQPTSSSLVIPGNGVRHFGVWLDDASVLPIGNGWTTFGAGYWRSTLGHQWDVPSLDAGFALAPKLQMGISAPVSHATYLDGYSTRGLGDLYVSAKCGLINPESTTSRFGLAVVPVLEILSSAPVGDTAGIGRVQWAIPVTAERRFDKFRVYGAGGYFSRGALFVSGALEVPVNDKLTVTGTLSNSRSLTNDALSDELGLSKTRLDASGGVMYVLRSSIVLFGSLGRTLSQADANASTLAISGGVSFAISPSQHDDKPQPTPAPKKKIVRKRQP